MINGAITRQGIYFEIDLITSDGEFIPVDALFDTGFTSGILGIHIQDVEAVLLAIHRYRKESTDGKWRS